MAEAGNFAAAAGPFKVLLAPFDATDEWEGAPLAEELVRRLEHLGVAGATVLSGILGFGTHRRIHHKGLFGVLDNKPAALVAVDRESKLREALAQVRPMIRGGVVVLLEAELIPLAVASAGAPREDTAGAGDALSD